MSNKSNDSYLAATLDALTKGVKVLGLVSAFSIAPVHAQNSNLAPNMSAVPIGDVAQWFGPESYPFDASQAARQGRVVVNLEIDQSGAVKTCSVEQSSGTASLDAATCSIAKAHLRFNPATNDTGQPKIGTYLLPIAWIVPAPYRATPVDLTSPANDNVVSSELVFDASGTLLSCRPLQITSPAQVVNPCISLKAGTATTRRWTRNGKPVGAIVIQQFTEHVTPAP